MKWLVPDGIKAEIIAYCLKYEPKEVGGILFGVEATITGIEVLSIGRDTEVKMTDALARVVESFAGKKIIVGWWHSHPFNMPYFSATDIKTQALYKQLYPKALGILAYKNEKAQWRVKEFTD